MHASKYGCLDCSLLKCTSLPLRHLPPQARGPGLPARPAEQRAQHGGAAQVREGAWTNWLAMCCSLHCGMSMWLCQADAARPLPGSLLLEQDCPSNPPLPPTLLPVPAHPTLIALSPSHSPTLPGCWTASRWRSARAGCSRCGWPQPNPSAPPACSWPVLRPAAAAAAAAAACCWRGPQQRRQAPLLGVYGVGWGALSGSKVCAFTLLSSAMVLARYGLRTSN